MDVIWVWILATPVVLFFGRGLLYGRQRVNGVKMSPTQFPEGYALVVEAAQQFGLSEVPDAYVVLGNGVINAAASGHGFRRYVVVYSDLFEIGGRARDPEALAFVIGHEVGHIAAGHASYWRQLGQLAMELIPFLGQSLSRSMEYTADNYGYAFRPAGARHAHRRTERRKVSAQVGGFRRHGRPGDIGDRILRLVGQHAVLASGEYLARGSATQPCRRGLAVLPAEENLASWLSPPANCRPAPIPICGWRTSAVRRPWTGSAHATNRHWPSCAGTVRADARRGARDLNADTRIPT